MSTEPKIVKFIKHWRGYNPGEVAGFSAATAESLEKAKIAEPHDPGQDGKKPAQRQQTGTGRRATTKAPEGAQQTDAGTSTAQDADPSTTPPGDATTSNQDAAATSAQSGGPTDNDDRP